MHFSLYFHGYRRNVRVSNIDPTLDKPVRRLPARDKRKCENWSKPKLFYQLGYGAHGAQRRPFRNGNNIFFVTSCHYRFALHFLPRASVLALCYRAQVDFSYKPTHVPPVHRAITSSAQMIFLAHYRYPIYILYSNVLVRYWKLLVPSKKFERVDWKIHFENMSVNNNLKNKFENTGKEKFKSLGTFKHKICFQVKSRIILLFFSFNTTLT